MHFLIFCSEDGVVLAEIKRLVLPLLSEFQHSEHSRIVILFSLEGVLI